MKFLHRATNTYIFAVGDSAQEYLKDSNYSLTVDADFKESDHPRDKSGKFGSGGGGSKGIEKHKPRFSTFDKPTSMPSTAGKITYKSPSTAEEKKFDNHKIYNGGEHTHTIGKQSVGSNEYIVKNIKSGEVKEFPNKESALKSVENPSQKSGSGKQTEIHNRYKQLKSMDKEALIKVVQSKGNIDMSHIKSEPAEEIRYHILNKEFNKKDLEFDVRKEPKGE